MSEIKFELEDVELNSNEIKSEKDSEIYNIKFKVNELKKMLAEKVSELL